ncbi:hypothetical protein EON65_07190 [archaeon]|nr:MAG: hypothetical protein EON65_07190 [archaeon]
MRRNYLRSQHFRSATFLLVIARCYNILISTINCHVLIESYIDGNLCGFPGAVLQFFMVASEMWFLCNGIDLFYSITNPFSSFKSR